MELSFTNNAVMVKSKRTNEGGYAMDWLTPFKDVTNEKDALTKRVRLSGLSH